MNEKIAILYTKQIKEDYLYYIKENFSLMRKLFEEEKKCPPYSRDETSREHKLFCQCRVKHFQMMTILGMNAEHILKIILLKNGYIINIGFSEEQFEESFLKKIEIFEETNFDDISQEQKALNNLYNEAEQLINNKRTISFYNCIELFKKCIKNDKEYFTSIKKYSFNISKKKIFVDGKLLESHLGPAYNYLGFKEISPHNALDIIREMRNNYIHVANAHSERQGIIHYLYNFLLYLCVKEFRRFFTDEKYLPEMKAKIEGLFPAIEDII
jgi:hypothetical protein